MKKELDDALCQKYPLIFKDRHADMQTTCMCWGFECGDGWYALLDNLCGQLQWNTDQNDYPQVVATQVKEKYGTLRFYYSTFSPISPDGGYKEGSISGAIDFAERMSGITCEECGKPGTANKTGWISVRCPEHR